MAGVPFGEMLDGWEAEYERQIATMCELILEAARRGNDIALERGLAWIEALVLSLNSEAN